MEAGPRAYAIVATALLTVFSGTFHIIVLSVLRANVVAGLSSKLFLLALFTVVFALFCGLLFERRYKFDFNMTFLFICIYALLACMLLATGLGQRESNALFNSEVQAYLILVLCTIMSASLLVSIGEFGVVAVCKMIPAILILYTLGTSISLLFSSGLTTGGLMSDESGLNYQSNSYCAAYAIGLSLYCMGDIASSSKDIDMMKPLMPRPLLLVLLCIQFSVVFLSGGRGGLVTAFALVFFWLYTQRSIFTKNVRLLIGGVVGVALLIMCVALLLKSSTLEYSGFDRLLSFLDGGGDANRNMLRSEAFALIAQKPLLGHGPGSVFFLLNTYSHNIFTDILIEYGLIGLSVFLAVGIWGLVIMRRQIRNDHRERIWAYIFIMGLTMLLFSSYYLVSVMCIYPLLYQFIKRGRKVVA